MNKTTEIIKVVTEVEITYSMPEGREYLVKQLGGRMLAVDMCGGGDSGSYSAKSLKSEVLEEKPPSIPKDAFVLSCHECSLTRNRTWTHPPARGKCHFCGMAVFTNRRTVIVLNKDSAHP